MEFLVLVIGEEGLVVILEVVVVVFLTFTSLISFASKVGSGSGCIGGRGGGTAGSWFSLLTFFIFQMVIGVGDGSISGRGGGDGR
jgi:hypothetical protein